VTGASHKKRTEFFVRDLSIVQATRTQDIGRYVVCVPLVHLAPGSFVTVVDSSRKLFTGRVVDEESGQITIDTFAPE